MEGRDQRQAELKPTAPPFECVVRDHLDAFFAHRSLPLRVENIEQIAGGFEHFIARVWLRPASAASGRRSSASTLLFAGEPLVLRLSRRPDAAANMAWEARVLAAVHRAGIPVPRLALTALDAGELGGSFLLLEFVRGTRLDLAMAAAGTARALQLFRAFASAQASIFAVRWRPRSTTTRPNLPISLITQGSIEQRLVAAAAEIETRRLDFLHPVLHWLHCNRSLLGWRAAVFLHGDFHPRNILTREGAVSGVVDWAMASFGDPHLDIGWTSLLLATFGAETESDDAGLVGFRAAAPRIYLACLRSVFPWSEPALAYGEVWAALRWLLLFLPSYLPEAGPPVLNSEAAGILNARYVERVARFVEERTRLRLLLPAPR